MMAEKFSPPQNGGSYIIEKPGERPVRTEFTLQPGEKGHGASRPKPVKSKRSPAKSPVPSSKEK